MALSPTVVQWRGAVLTGDFSGPFGVRNVAGWDERPGVRTSGSARPAAHGAFSGLVMADERVVTVVGQIAPSPDRDALLADLDAEMYYTLPGAALESLTITRAGRTLTAFARLTAFRTPTDLDWSVGAVPFGIEWRCPDPLRYGDPVQSITQFPRLRGGLRYPLYTDGAGVTTGWLDYGEPSDTGRVVLQNPGTAPVPVQFQVAGPVASAGFDIVQVGSDARLTFEGPVAAGSSLVLDGATGAVLIDGTADRAGRLTWRDWPVVPPRGQVELAFLPRGARTDAVLTAVVRPGWW